MERHPEREDRALWAAFREGSPGERRSPCPGAGDFAAYLEGNVSAAAAREIEAHLSGCDACLTAMGELRSLLAAPPLDVPPDVRQRAKALVPRGAVPAPVPWFEVVRRSIGIVAAWAAAAALIVAMGAAGYRMGQYPIVETLSEGASSYLAPGFSPDGVRSPGNGGVSGLFTGGAL